MTDPDGPVREELAATLDRAGFEGVSPGDVRVEVTDPFRHRLGECRSVDHPERPTGTRSGSSVACSTTKSTRTGGAQSVTKSPPPTSSRVRTAVSASDTESTARKPDTWTGRAVVTVGHGLSRIRPTTDRPIHPGTDYIGS